MPRIESSDCDAEGIDAAIDAFAAAFKRSRKGNLWRVWEGKTLTVFKRRDGWFGWSIADNAGAKFSPGGYGDEGEAIGGLWDKTERRYWA